MVRIGIVGVGNMGRSHIIHIRDGLVKNAKITAVCDIDPKRLEWMDSNGFTEVRQYLSAEEMYKSGEVDLVVIATPHYDHPTLAKLAFKYNLNVIIEKPAGVYTKQVREMNEEAEKTDNVFGIMYNQRTNPVYKKVRELIKNGELGEIKRAIWIITTWYRPQAYHDSGGWRSMWATEGGGVLINQCPHQLDLWWWMLGMPKRIKSFVGFGKHYNIEVEDDVTAFMEYENGATGLFITTTAEAPGTNRLEISGDRGKIIVEDDKITFYRTVIPEREFNKSNTVPFGQPEVWKCEIPTPGENTQHVGILNNVVSAIENKTELLAPGTQGINGLTISNAIHLSAWTDDWVYTDNLDEDLFYNILQDKIKNSTIKKIVKEQVSDVKGTH